LDHRDLPEDPNSQRSQDHLVHRDLHHLLAAVAAALLAVSLQGCHLPYLHLASASSYSMGFRHLHHLAAETFYSKDFHHLRPVVEQRYASFLKFLKDFV